MEDQVDINLALIITMITVKEEEGYSMKVYKDMIMVGEEVTNIIIQVLEILSLMDMVVWTEEMRKKRREKFPVFSIKLTILMIRLESLWMWDLHDRATRFVSSLVPVQSPPPPE